MVDITFTDLLPVLAGAVGELTFPPDESDMAEVSLLDLGLDSLALTEVIASAKRTWGVAIPDDALGESVTLATLVDLVNSLRTEVAR